MKKLLTLLTFFVISTSVCFGQTNTEYKTALKKMMVASGAENTCKVVINQMITAFKTKKSDVPEEFWTEMSAELLKTTIGDMADMLVPVYEKHLTLADINQLIAFYESPIGKKFAEKTPIITQESMQVGQQLGMKIGQKVVEKLKEKYN
ncbi:DUF2059 domain-containing protein [Pedobacter sp. LMG 31464]|uniref:DUF2059 domain-containing protein n=1 Tax=Pedobacter planticolens TaxID=2679964 RepID=A0A923IVG9_9SPHI|nr:DUF2059 domain-containing protein [Pedobacter planticolens]MBB2147015.1 DUF2059 domain-containing protein [Pedobacter planticolens]